MTTPDERREAVARLRSDLELQDGGGIAYTCQDVTYTVVVRGEDLRIALDALPQLGGGAGGAPPPTDVERMARRLEGFDRRGGLGYDVHDGLLAAAALLRTQAAEIAEKDAEIARLRAERDEAEADAHELTKALTGLTCSGSEFFIRKRGRYLANIKACVDWVQRRDTNAARRARDAILDKKAAEARAEAAERRLSEVREVLEWYAVQSRYIPDGKHWTAEVDLDKGQRARAALALLTDTPASTGEEG